MLSRPRFLQGYAMIINNMWRNLGWVNMAVKIIRLKVIIFMLASSSAQAQEDASFLGQENEPQYEVSLGMDYTSGTYGADERTEILYMPVSFKAQRGPWTAKAVLPWLNVAGPAIILDGIDGGSVGIRNTESAAGLGDLSLSMMYSFEQLYNLGLFLDFTARVKVPTASFGAGLGTGKSDASVQVDIAQAIGQFIPFATLGYKWTGVPAGFTLRNTVYGSVGLQSSWSENIATGLSFDYRQSSLRGSPDLQEGLAYLNVRFTEEWSLNIYSIVGFSENSPDAGGGITLVYRFP